MLCNLCASGAGAIPAVAAAALVLWDGGVPGVVGLRGWSGGHWRIQSAHIQDCPVQRELAPAGGCPVVGGAHHGVGGGVHVGDSVGAEVRDHCLRGADDLVVPVQVGE